MTAAAGQGFEVERERAHGQSLHQAVELLLKPPFPRLLHLLELLVQKVPSVHHEVLAESQAQGVKSLHNKNNSRIKQKANH